MTWYQLLVTASQSDATKISDYFSALGALSVTYSDASNQPIYEPPPGDTLIWNHTVITALFDSDANLSKIQAFITQQMQTACLQHWQQTTLEEQVWERTWLDHFQPMQFADRLWVCPSNFVPPDPNAVNIILDPGLAFGTGTHATTALCLEWLGQHDLKDKVVIDYGCGSGILALAALKLGAKTVHAIDIDPQALTATHDNAVKNQVEQQLHCYAPEQFASFKADLVIANILAKPLIEMAAKLCTLLDKQGQLVLSGILAEQVDSIVDAYQPFVQLSAAVHKEDWVRLNGIKRSS